MSLLEGFHLPTYTHARAREWRKVCIHNNHANQERNGTKTIATRLFCWALCNIRNITGPKNSPKLCLCCYADGQRRNRGSIPGSDKNPDQDCSPLSLPIRWVQWALTLVVKRLEREAVSSPPYSAFLT